jgi:hypothetical protein
VFWLAPKDGSGDGFLLAVFADEGESARVYGLVEDGTGLPEEYCEMV